MYFFYSQQLFISNPLEQFQLHDLAYFQVPLFSTVKFSLTNIGLYLIIVLLLISVINFIATNNLRILPSRWSISQESMYASIVSMVRNQIGNQNEIYVPLMYVIFNFVLFNNLIGLVPYSFTPTSYLIITIALSTTIVLAVTLIGLLRHGLVFFSYFVPAGTPLALVPLLVVIEIISYIARSLSLGLRLGANIIAGHSLLKIFSGFTSSAITIGPIIMICSILPLLVLTILYSLELAIAFLQAYVFTILTSSYLKDALDLH
jgi:F-type H+-transporting ATPase subunit a